MDRLREDLRQVSARLEELENSQKMSLREIDGLKGGVDETTRGVAETRRGVEELTRGVEEVRRGVDELKRGVTGLRNSTLQGHQATSELRGVFASIETHMVDLFENDGDLRAQVADLTARVESLEKKAS